LIQDSREFVVNVPGIHLIEESHLCGVKSGREIDKFSETGLTILPSKKVKSPGIEECFGHLECRVVQTHTCGDHTLFVGEVVSAKINEAVFVDDKMDPLKSKPITQKNHVYYGIIK
jgi:flavin reductase (DIM6/NTAB) family NADH-FMN oxidoreductase RutF